MRIPDFPDLRPLELDDYALLAGRLNGSAPPICDMSPANLLIWRDCETPSIAQVCDSVCILLTPHCEPAYFLEPVGGARRVEAVRACLGMTGRISRVSKAAAELLSKEEFEIRSLRDHFDYIYCTQSLAELKGKKHDGKRNQIRRFARACPDYEFRPLERSRFGDAMALFARWTEWRSRNDGAERPASAFSFHCQRHALHRAFADFEALGLRGGAMLVRGELQGFIVGSTSPGATAVVHFQYANPEVPGIYQALLNEACRNLFEGCRYINLEEDLGLPGLRRTKLSYDPLHFEEKFDIRCRIRQPDRIGPSPLRYGRGSESSTEPRA